VFAESSDAYHARCERLLSDAGADAGEQKSKKVEKQESRKVEK